MIKYCQGFADYLLYTKKRKEGTIEQYLRHLRIFIKYYPDIAPDQINTTIIDDFIKKLHTQETLAPPTVNLYLISIRRFLHYCLVHDIPAFDPIKIECSRKEGRKVEYLEKEEIEKLLLVFKGDDIRMVRDKAIVELLIASGLRISELVSLNRRDINFTTKTFQVIGKRDKCRIVFFTERAAKALKAYITLRNDNSPALFVNIHCWGAKRDDKRRLTQTSIADSLSVWAKKAGIKKRVYPHLLRHSFATIMLNNGIDIYSISELLGHAQVTTTQIYLHSSNQRLKASFDRFAVQLR